MLRIGIAVHRRGGEVQSQRQEQQREQPSLPPPRQDDEPRRATEKRRRAAALRPAHRIGQHAPRVFAEKPADQSNRMRQRRKAVLPHPVHLGLVPLSHGKVIDGQHGEKPGGQQQIEGKPRQPAAAAGPPEGIADDEADAAAGEQGGKGESDRRQDHRRQRPEPAVFARPAEPMDRQREHRQGEEEVAGIGLGLGRIANGRIGNGEDAEGHDQGHSAEQHSGQVAEEEQAGDSANEGHKPQGVFRKAQQFDDRELAPEEQRRRDLDVVQRFEHLPKTAVEEIGGQHGLVFPQGEPQHVADRPCRNSDEQESQQPLGLSLGREQFGVGSQRGLFQAGEGAEMMRVVGGFYAFCLPGHGRSPQIAIHWGYSIEVGGQSPMAIRLILGERSPHRGDGSGGILTSCPGPAYDAGVFLGHTCMEQPVTIRFRWTADELLQGYRYHFRHTCRPVFRFGLNAIFVFGVVAGVLMLTVPGADDKARLTLSIGCLIAGIYWFVVRPFERRWIVRRRFRKRPDRGYGT